MILRQDAERKILEPLRTHGWVAAIDSTIESGDDHLIISAERGGQKHRIGLLYSSATSSGLYRALACEGEHIFFNGAPYMVESFARSVSKPVRKV